MGNMQKAAMYDSRYTNTPMMPRNQGGCNSCVNARMMNGCDNQDTCMNPRMRNGNEECGNSMRDELRGMPIAMGYVPWQNFGCTYEPMEGFRAGTIFPELDKPFYGRRGMR